MHHTHNLIDMNNKNILIVENQQYISDQLAPHLVNMGAEVSHITDGANAQTIINSKAWDLVLLDVQLSKMSGLEICSTLRKLNNFVPIILLTSETSETDRILGLEAGADDLIAKPFSILEVIARIKALFRRVEAKCPSMIKEQSTVQLGELSIDRDRHEVLVKGHKVELTAREFSLLEHFARHPGQVFSKNELLNRIWGYGYQGYEHTVNSHINRLRTKLNTMTGKAEYIVTVWGVGYKLEQP